MIAFPPSSLASGNTDEISRYYMTKSRLWPIPIGNLIILKNVRSWLLSPKLRLLSRQNTRILGHQRRRTSPNQPKAPRHTRWPATNCLLYNPDSAQLLWEPTKELASFLDKQFRRKMSYDQVYEILNDYSITSVDCLITSKTQQLSREVETDNCRPRNFKRCFGTSNPIPRYSCSTSHSCHKMFGFNSFSYTDVDAEVLRLLSFRAIKKVSFITENLYSRLFLVPKKEGSRRPGPSKQVCRKLPLPNGKHLLPKDPPEKERLFDMHRLE